jgi:L-asparaginase/Glu-tRNA(Gln) amidotransferase subunit D
MSHTSRLSTSACHKIPDDNIQLLTAFYSNSLRSLPTTMIFATGGTIAGRGASSTASGVYQAGSIGVGALVDGESHTLIFF